MIPYKLYINWTGKYTTGTMSGTFTDVTDDVYDLSISVSRERDKKSIAIIRHFAKGSFVVKGDNYDLLQTAIANGLPELVIKIEQYSESGDSYVEVWRGVAETRPSEMDVNRKVAKISKFKTVDIYSDLDVAYTNKWSEIFKDYMTAPKGLGFNGNVQFFDGKRLFDVDIPSDNFEVININSKIYNKYYNLTSLKIVPGHYDGTWQYYWGSDFGVPRGMYYASTYVYHNPTESQEAQLSIKQVMDTYKNMYNLFWYIDDAYYGTPTPVRFDSIQFKSPDQLFGLTTLDYTNESRDFAAFSYIDTEYFIREKFEMSPSNFDADHISQSYEYQLLAENEFIYSNDNLVTDMYVSIGGTSDRFLKSDLFLLLGEWTTTDIADAKSAPPINSTVISQHNYKAALSFRMRDHLNDYRQLGEALFNGSIQSINPNITLPSVLQEKFPISLDLITDLDFTATIETSIGNTFAQEVIWDIKTNSIHLICQK